MKEKTFITELIPHTPQKSYYGKAKVILVDGTHYLMSYKTIVGSVDKDGNVHRYWGGRSHTTSKHIMSFLENFETGIIHTRDFYDLPIEETPSLTINI